MSLVGPRPLILEEDRLFSGWQRSRYLVAPGVTGPWQILGSSRVPVSDMVTIDYLYCANWSLWLDAKILARTVPYVLSRRSGEHRGAVGAVSRNCPGLVSSCDIKAGQLPAERPRRARRRACVTAPRQQ